MTQSLATPCAKVLVVDDDHGISRLIRKALSPLSIETEIRDSGKAAIRWLDGNEADLILLDFRLPDMTADQLLGEVESRGSQRPLKPGMDFIIITGYGDERVAVEMMKRGARDYLMKDDVFLDLLPTVVEQTLERLRREKRLQETEEALHLLQSAVTQMRDAVVIVSATLEDGWPDVVYVNPAFTEMMGYRRSEVTGLPFLRILSDDANPQLSEDLRDSVLKEDCHRGRATLLRHDGTKIRGDLEMAPIRSVQGRVTHFVITIRDVTDQEQQEQLMRRTQRMEALGLLAGGIAHDFNNALTVILGHTELLQGGGDSHSALKDIRNAAEYAGSLTRQLLAFSRQKVSVSRIVDLCQTVERGQQLFRRVIGEDISIETGHQKRPNCIDINPGQIEQVLMNLVINARDAMPDGGVIRIETGTTLVDEHSSWGVQSLAPGRYATLAVIDEGVGMNAETLEHIFEPFYTTKESGRGTGLGFSTVYGIVHNSGGDIAVKSSPSAGTAFTALFPEVNCPSPSSSAPTGKAAIPKGSETVLIAEDESAVRKLVCTVLARQGYRILEASRPDEAIEVSRELAPNGVDLIMTDVVMPGGNGVHLVSRLKEKFPDAVVIFMSGYVEGRLDQKELDRFDAQFIQKPFTPSELAKKVRECLDDAARKS